MTNSKVSTGLRIGVAIAMALSLALTGPGVTGAAQASTPGEACLFSAPYGAIPTGGLVGHIGWGFRNGTGNDWIYGATEGVAGINGLIIPPGQNTNSWHNEGTQAQMLAAFGTGAHSGFSMGQGYYLQYRCATVPDSNPSTAMTAVAVAEGNGYDLPLNNCLDKAISILTAYQTPNLIPPFALEFPNYYFMDQLPPAFGSVQYFTTLTIAAKVVDPLTQQYLNTNPVHAQREMRVIISTLGGNLVYDSGYSVTATLTPGTDRYQATIQLPSPSPLDSNFQEWSSGGSPGDYLVSVQLQYTLPGLVSASISQAHGNTVADADVTAGDINGDGHVDIADYELLTQCFSDISPPVGPCDPNLKVAADLDDDGHVNGTDYNELLRVFKSLRGG